MATCTYTFNNESGKSVTLAGIPALKTYLVMGGLEHFGLASNIIKANEPLLTPNDAKSNTSVTLEGKVKLAKSKYDSFKHEMKNLYGDDLYKNMTDNQINRLELFEKEYFDAKKEFERKPILYTPYPKIENKDFLDVDGQLRSVLNSNGKRISNSDENIRNFWRWFDDSVVVDSKGRPLVLNHGTNSEFYEFNIDNSGYNTISNANDDATAATSLIGHWFNTEPMDKHSGYDKNIVVYLKINELKNEGSLGGLSQSVEEYITGDLEDDYDNDKYFYLKNAADEYKNHLERNGVDGIVIDDEEFGGKSYVVFDANQIKSATANTGQFNPNNNDIRFSIADTINDAADKIKKDSNISSITEGIKGAQDGLMMATMPQYRTAEAREISRQLIEQMGIKEHEKAKFKIALDKAYKETEHDLTLAGKARDLLLKGLSLAADKAFIGKDKSIAYGFMQAMDSEDKSFFVEHPELKDLADVIEKMWQQKAAQIQYLGTGALQTLRENYFKHLWKARVNEDVEKQIHTALSKRPLEGSKGFTKQRIYQDFQAGIDAGLEPISNNPLDIVMLSMNEMDKYIMAHTILNQMKKDGMKVFVRTGQKAQPGWVPIDDRYGTVWGPGIVKGSEHIDKAVYDGLSAVVKDLGIAHDRLVSAGRGKLGYSEQGLGHIVTQNNTETSVLAHEIGHQIDAKYDLWQRIVKEAEGLGKRGTVTKSASQKARAIIKQELRAIADEVADRGAKTYSRKRPEQVAQMVEIYSHAPELMKNIAPNTYKAFDDLVKATPDLKGLAGIQPGIKLKGIGYETRLAGPIMMGHYYVPEAVGQVINNYLSPTMYNDKYVGNMVKGYMGIANLLNRWQLGLFSAFHAGFTTHEAVISRNAQAIKALSQGRVKDAVSLFANVLPQIWQAPMFGDKILEAYRNGNPESAEMAAIVDGLRMAGAKFEMDQQFQTNSTKNMLSDWQEGKKFRSLFHAINTIAEQSTRPTLEWLVPRQKAAVFGEMYNEWMKLNQGASHDEMRNSAIQVWNRIDARLGQVVYDRLFIRNYVKNFAQMLLRAPGWAGGTVTELLGGVKDLALWAKNPSMGMTDRTAYTLSMLMTTALINAALTAAFTGEPPDDWKDLIAFKTGNLDEKGEPERFLLPTYMKDVYSWAQNGPLTTLEHKAHPLLNLVGDVISNRDYYGTEIRSEDDSFFIQMAQTAGYTLKQFEPFWVRGWEKESERSGSLMSQSLPLIGIMPAPGYMNKTAAEKLMSKYGADELPQGARTKEEAAKADLRRKMYVSFRKGDQPQAKEIWQQGKDDGILSNKDYLTIAKQARKDPLLNSFSRLTYAQAKRVYDLADEHERVEMEPILRHKKMLELKKGMVVD